MIRRLALFVALILALGGLLGWVQVRLGEEPPPIQVVLLGLQEEGDGLVAQELKGLRTCLEVGLAPSGRSVLRAEQGVPGPDVAVLEARLSARRVAEFLQVRLDLGRRGQRPRPLNFGPGEPSQVLQQALAALGGRPDDLARLLPRQRVHQWTLLEALADGLEVDDLEQRCRRALDREPDVPLLWTALGRCLSRRLQVPAPRDVASLLQELEATHRNALAIAPRHPWLTAAWSAFQIDHGRPDLAVEEIFQILDANPWNLDLLDLLSQAARRAGLLDGAQRVLRLQGQWLGKGQWQHGPADLALAYRGDWGAFEAGLRQCEPSPHTAFLRAYACLLRGRPDEAGPWFELATRKADFEGRLAQAMLHWLQGRQGTAQDLLQVLDADLRRLGAADGELALRLAEAQALAGAHQAAQDMAAWAVTQGFLVRSWLEESPFLAPLQGRPGWASLLDDADARHQAMARRFPAHRFGI